MTKVRATSIVLGAPMDKRHQICKDKNPWLEAEFCLGKWSNEIKENEATQIPFCIFYEKRTYCGTFILTKKFVLGDLARHIIQHCEHPDLSIFKRWGIKPQKDFITGLREFIETHEVKISE